MKYVLKKTINSYLLLLTCITISCQETPKQEKTVIIESSKSSQAESTFESKKKSLDERYSLVLNSDIKNGTARVQINFLERLVSSASCGNCEFIEKEKGEIKIDTLSFSDNRKGFLITAFIRGSNYSAKQYYIIHQNPYWNITVLPFDVADFKDIDRDGVDEIIRIERGKESRTYNFDKGILKEVE